MNLFKNIYRKYTLLAQSGILIIASGFANFLSLIFNAYLGRTLSFSDFALVGLTASFFYLTSIPFSPIFSTVSFETAFLIGRDGDKAAEDFLRHVKSSAFSKTLIISIIWLLLSPFIAKFFHLKNMLPVILFTPVWFVGAFSFANKGFMFGKLMFGVLALTYIFEPVIKLLLAILFININMSQYVYISIPLSFFLAFVFSEIFVKKTEVVKEKINAHFPKKFYLGAVLSMLSSMTFLSFDILLANHYLSTTDAGKYTLISMVGKMIYLLGGMVSQFLGPLVSRKEGENKNSTGVFYKLVLLTTLFVLGGFLVVGVFSPITMPFLFGAKTVSILKYLPIYSFATACYTVSGLFLYYLLAKKIYLPSIISFFNGLFEVILIFKFHYTISSFVNSIAVVGILNLILMVGLYVFKDYLKVFEHNAKDFLEMFAGIKKTNAKIGKHRILIFNWRDTKHMWAGGAEVYIHEIAKRWVEDGNHVTLFCGNDMKCSRNEVVDGVNVIRRGGFYTVYLWAALYYIFKFRKNYDIIIDSENGIPFFSPLFSTKPVILLIHHVHQEIFIEQMKFPLSYIGKFIEGKLMPSVYANRLVITVSESTKKELIKSKIAKEKNILIVNPGINFPNKIYTKTKFPSFIYLGRLKPYKNIDIAIKAFNKVKKSVKDAKFLIVGDGECGKELQDLAHKLKLKDNVIFFGKVTDAQKVEYLSKSWIALQPSQVEGWGITVLEANACGTPVIASDTNGLRDSIQHTRTGILVKIKDINEFAKNMLWLVNDREVLKYFSKNAKNWSERFSWEASSVNFYDAVNAEIAEKRPLFIFQKIGYMLTRITSLF